MGVDLSRELHLTFDRCSYDNELYTEHMRVACVIRGAATMEDTEDRSFYISLCMTTGPL